MLVRGGTGRDRSVELRDGSGLVNAEPNFRGDRVASRIRSTGVPKPRPLPPIGVSMKNLLGVPALTLPYDARAHESEREPNGEGDGRHGAQPGGDDGDEDGECDGQDPSDPAIEPADLDRADERNERLVAVLRGR